MKRFTLPALCLLALMVPAALPAQVLNGGFELNRTDNTIANWELTTMFVMPLDSPACALDSLYFQNNDPYEGKYALELRTIACNGTVVSPKLFASDDIPSYGPSEPFIQTPQAFSFYYKFFPVAGEGIRMRIELLNEEFGPVAVADSIFYPGTVSAYTQAVLPLAYSSDLPPQRLALQFYITDSNGGMEYGDPGSRLLIDDIKPVQGTTSLTDRSLPSGNPLRCYPTIAAEAVFLEMKQAVGPCDVRLFDIAGRELRHLKNVDLGRPVPIAVGDLPQGMYFVRVAHRAGQYSGRFMHK